MFCFHLLQESTNRCSVPIFLYVVSKTKHYLTTLSSSGYLPGESLTTKNNMKTINSNNVSTQFETRNFPKEIEIDRKKELAKVIDRASETLDIIVSAKINFEEKRDHARTELTPGETVHLQPLIHDDVAP